MIPGELAALFWDTDLAGFNPAAYPDYTILRVLEYGDTPALDWLRKTFPDDEIRRVLRTERRLSPKSATFWALYFGVQADQVAALRDPQSPVLPAHG